MLHFTRKIRTLSRKIRSLKVEKMGMPLILGRMRDQLSLLENESSERLSSGDASSAPTIQHFLS
jgi:hypothetical protein